MATDIGHDPQSLLQDGAKLFFGIAPFTPDMDLSRVRFRAVHTCNLTRSSMGFFTLDRVDHDELAVIFATEELDPIYVRAVVVNSKPSAYGDRQGYMVACDFVERLSPLRYRR